jgi:CRISPR-associated endoribonuclease Cas6
VLIKLAAYCCTGHKTTFGLGQTRLTGKDETRNGNNGKDPITTTPIQEHLIKRIAELTALFLQTKNDRDAFAHKTQLQSGRQS